MSKSDISDFDWERVGVRGYGLSIGRNPSPGSHLSMRSDLSHKGRGDTEPAARAKLLNQALTDPKSVANHAGSAPAGPPRFVLNRPPAGPMLFRRHGNGCATPVRGRARGSG